MSAPRRRFLLGGGALALLAASPVRPASPKTSFWDRPRRGANFFNRVETAERLEAAAAAGVRFVRLAPNKWKAAGRDFLVGDADAFRGIPPADLNLLRARLDEAHAAGLKVVLTTLTLPGARWRQHHGNRSDFRLWTDGRYAAQAEAFWRELAAALQGHPALVGYNLLNEPHPERASGAIEPAAFDWSAYAERTRGATGDLNGLYARLVRAVRAADPVTPVVLDSASYADPNAFAALRPLDDPAVLYAFHMYEPYAFTSARRRDEFSYPGLVPLDADQPGLGSRRWDRSALERYLAPVRAWQLRHRVAPDRILAGEFGCYRRAPGAATYLSDLIGIFEAEGWHWAFYAYREDTWDAMDYELGDGPTPRGFWAAVDGGRTPEVLRSDNPIWSVVRRGLAAGR